MKRVLLIGHYLKRGVTTVQMYTMYVSGTLYNRSQKVRIRTFKVPVVPTKKEERGLTVTLLHTYQID